ncbi:GNAT family N-acetyltransferase [Absiella sp. AM29-15]|uniref:GNAT family N-acetyltransferase n=1 Tax=Absiella sp. AM29-15 TaxID=2292278 RepID=UPI000E40DA5D|nr:GNAT family N-acetyltransferase [Absiella sp. AM29-15]RGC50900.1 GNAT family N-acetyltransferase [Absiella sp. AM29-15]
MEYKQAERKDLKIVYDIVQEAIATVYPKYYPNEVVAFFHELHSMENIEKDIIDKRVGVLLDHDEVVGTGCYEYDHITRVYVRPAEQKKGYGSYIIEQLEKMISQTYPSVGLDASLPACHLYEQRGYQTITHGRHLLEHGVVLVYEIMEKKF